MNNFSIATNEFRAISCFMSNDPSRSIINSVCIELYRDKNPILISTDGQCIGVIQSTYDNHSIKENENLVIKSEAVTRILKIFGTKFKRINFRKIDAFQWIVGDDQHGETLLRLNQTDFITDGDDITRIKMAFYPNYRQTILHYFDKLSGQIRSFCVNPTVSKPFSKCIDLLIDNKHTKEANKIPTFLTVENENNVFIVKHNDVPNFFGVCKGINNEVPDTTLPHWFPKVGNIR